MANGYDYLEAMQLKKVCDEHKFSICCSNARIIIRTENDITLGSTDTVTEALALCYGYINGYGDGYVKGLTEASND